MSFITCCPSCGTKFRVVADQLRISDGWVRCGRCQEVFDAQAALEPLPSADTAADISGVNAMHAASSDPEAAAAPLPSAQTQLAVFSAPAQPTLMAATPAAGYELPAPPELELDFEVPDAASSTASVQATAPIDADDWLDLPTTENVREPFFAVPVAPAAVSDPVQLPESAHTPELATAAASGAPALEPQGVLQAEESQAGMWAEVVRFMHPPKPQEATGDAVVSPSLLPMAAAQAGLQDGDLDVASGDTEVPGFVKQAQRKAWWNQPGVRFVMGMLIIFLPIALMLQIVVHERNRIAAWKPQWRNQLDLMCVVLRCEITPHRDIAAVVLTGSSFVQEAQPHHYKLDLSIHNQSNMSVATPAVELTLTDAQDQVLVRKVLNLAEIGAPNELAARGEWNGTLPVMTQGLNLPVSGYRVMAFYP